jgi:hypothetical protein
MFLANDVGIKFSFQGYLVTQKILFLIYIPHILRLKFGKKVVNWRVNAHYNVLLWKLQRQTKLGYSGGESMIGDTTKNITISFY